MQNIAVGVCYDGTVDVDFDVDEDRGWNFNNLTLAEAEFLQAELTHAVTRARLRQPPVPAPVAPATARTESSTEPTEAVMVTHGHL